MATKTIEDGGSERFLSRFFIDFHTFCRLNKNNLTKYFVIIAHENDLIKNTYVGVCELFQLQKLLQNIDDREMNVIFSAFSEIECM